MTSIDQFLSQNILCCVSSLVSDIAKMYGGGSQDPEILEEAWILACPVQDYEEAAIQEGWTGPHVDQYGVTYFEDTTDGQTWTCPDWEILCITFDIEPYDWEVYEHWAITDYLAEKLKAHGEKVGELSGLTIWARTTTGQSISMDGVIQRIYAETMLPES